MAVIDEKQRKIDAEALEKDLAKMSK